MIVLGLAAALAAALMLDFVVAFDLDLWLAGWLAEVSLAVERAQGLTAVAQVLRVAVAVEAVAVVEAGAVVVVLVGELVMIVPGDSLWQRQDGWVLVGVVWLVPVPGSRHGCGYSIVIEHAAWQ